MSTDAGLKIESQGLIPQDGSTFESQPLQIATTEEILLVMLDQKPGAFKALAALDVIAKQQDRFFMAVHFPELEKSSDVVEIAEDAKARKHDNESVWRKQTDDISLAIGRNLPYRDFGSLFYTEGRFYTDSRKLIYELDGQVNVFSSYDYNTDFSPESGVRASDDLWEDLLDRICLTREQ